MSWGFEQRHEPIARAIQDAFKRKTIMFAAASNLGANGPKGYGVTFPAWMPEVICVNASDGYGKYSSFNPEPRPGSFNFLTLGEAVLAAERSGGGGDGDGPAKPEGRLTGTSFSTPVAAAMAALFIEFVMQKPLRRDIKLREEVVTQDGIIKLFAGMSEDQVQGFRYLRPWRLIHCEARSDGHDCKTCRTHAAERVKELLSGPLPVADDSARVPDLPHAPEAELESQINEGKDVCLPETRVELLEDIQTWVDDPKGKLVWWLAGKTGTGKSTLARTVAANLSAKQQLSACFFFSRNHQSCHDASTFVTSIAYQLGKASPVLAKAMSAAIAKDGDLAKLEKGRSSQWERLVLEPLSFLRTGTGPQRVVVVVDALDECNEVRDIISVLQLLGKADRPDIGLRVLLTSRPERPIEEEFGDGKGLFSKSNRFDLGEIPRPTVDKDISTLIRHELDRLKARLGVYGLPSDYLDGPLVERLTQKSDGLFIYAKVACGYIDGGDHPGQQQSTTPKQRLDLVLTDEGFKDLDSLYAKILERAVSGDDESLVTKQLRQVLEALVAMFEPTPETTFRKLCPGGLDPVLVNARLGSLQSVLMARDKPVQVFHESFRTFLLRKADRRFLIDEKEAHRSLFGTNLAHLSDVQNPALRRDMLNLARPGVIMDQIELHRAERDGCVSAETRYACRYWVDHLDLLDIPDRAAVGLVDDGPVHVFLRRHLLHWIEVLSLIKSLPKGLAMMEKLAGHAEVSSSCCCPRLSVSLPSAHPYLISRQQRKRRAAFSLWSGMRTDLPGDTCLSSRTHRCSCTRLRFSSARPRAWCGMSSTTSSGRSFRWAR
jgi:hypothetical protein